MPPEVSVIVVTWNARALVDRCLDAVFGAGGEGVGLEVLVVDNASGDGTAQHVREAWPDARVVETGRNGGMAAGNNAGMLEASGRTFLLLNSDCFLEPGAIAALLRRLDDDPAAGAVVPRLRNADGSHQRSIRGFPTPWRLTTEFWYLRRLAPRSRRLNASYGAGIDPAEPGVVDWATGACLLVPRTAVDRVGLMDEAYFMYGEELDWLRRMHDDGLHVAYEPTAEAVHLGGGSAERAWGELYQRQLANHLRYMSLREGADAARAAQRLLGPALRVRAALYRALALLPGRSRVQRRARAAAFAAGARTIAEFDVIDVVPPYVPAWSGVQRESSPAR